MSSSVVATETRSTGLLPRFASGPVGVVVAAQTAVLTVASGWYGFHRDELYFLAAGKRLDWGYVDQPPITPLLAWLSTTLFSETPSGLRVASTLAGTATVLLVALVARELGGGRTVQWVSAAAAALSSFVVVTTHMVSTTTFDMLIWVGLGFVVMRLLRTGDGRWWVLVGAVIGIGLANKWLILMLVSVLAIGVLAVGPRSVLRSWWLAVGIAVCLALAAPILIWQAAHDFPLLTVASGISADDGAANRVLFVPMQLVYLSPVLVPVWVAGIVRLWRDPEVRWGRAFAVSYPLLGLELLILGGKPYYSVPLLLVLLPAGMPAALAWLTRGRLSLRRGLGGAGAAVGIVMSVIIGLPALPASALNGFVLGVNKEQGEQAGWPEFATTVSSAWQQITPDQRGRAVILTRNYGQAGAIEHYGPQLGLPQPYSGHMSYADWGPPPDHLTGPVLVVGEIAGQTVITGCRQVAVHDNGIGLENEEQGTPVRVCDSPAEPWSQVWPKLRRFY
ncbi:MAG: glycosyltransferase family 39 protein [Kibdelosporangium sp.]